MARRSLRQKRAALKFIPASTPRLALFDTLRTRAGSLHASGNGLWHTLDPMLRGSPPVSRWIV